MYITLKNIGKKRVGVLVTKKLLLLISEKLSKINLDLSGLNGKRQKIG